MANLIKLKQIESGSALQVSAEVGSDLFKEQWLKYGDEPATGSYYIAVDLAGFEDVAKSVTSAVKNRLDQTAIAVVKVHEKGWWVKEIEYGRWDVRETAVKILNAARKCKTTCLGIEKGALKNAVMPYLNDLMRRNGVYPRIEELTHGNRKKTDRVMWSLQGRFEHGRIVLNKDGDWKTFTDQYLMFPHPQVLCVFCFLLSSFSFLFFPLPFYKLTTF